MAKPMAVVYCAGPFRSSSKHVPGQQDAWGIQTNVMNAMALALEVWRIGGAALCPHANTMFFQNAAPDNVWLEGDLALLAKCDAMIVTPRWTASAGTRAEIAFANEHNIPIFFTVRDLYAWMVDTGRVGSERFVEAGA